ncbi:hypothetical protein [Mammaliicoccus sciuri]|uniref:hypothetical protein n=1 Tax=Mammaliicoccus sciuri TaxID=1296 RepID=UPI0034DD8AAE
MNLLELQKIDFLLKKANNHSHNDNPQQLIFSMNGIFYTGDFIPSIDNLKVVLSDVLTFESDTKKVIGLKNENEWKQIAKSDISNFDFSDFKKLISRSSHSDKTYYLQLVIEMSKKYPIEFEETLPNYIYNIKSLSSNPSIDLPIIYVEQNTQFDFISLIPQK